MNRPPALTIIAVFMTIFGIGMPYAARARYLRGEIYPDGVLQALLVGAIWVIIGIGLFGLSRLAWIGAVVIMGMGLVGAVPEVLRGNLSGYALLVIFFVPIIVVLLSDNVIRAFWRRGLASGHTPRSSAPADPPYQAESEAGKTVQTEKSRSRNNNIQVLSVIIAILGIIAQLFTQEIKQLFGFRN